MPSIGEIETEIEIKNGEDVTGPNHIKVFLQLHAASQLVSHAASNNASVLTRVWPREATSQADLSPCRHGTLKQQNLVRNFHLILQNG